MQTYFTPTLFLANCNIQICRWQDPVMIKWETQGFVKLYSSVNKIITIVGDFFQPMQETQQIAWGVTCKFLSTLLLNDNVKLDNKREVFRVILISMKAALVWAKTEEGIFFESLKRQMSTKSTDGTMTNRLCTCPCQENSYSLFTL